MAKKNQTPKYPPLRFPEFKDEWKEVRLGEVATCSSSTMTEGELQKEGSIPIFGAAGCCGYADVDEPFLDSILIIKDGSGVGRLQYVTGLHYFLATLNSLKTTSTSISQKFVFYFLEQLNFTKYVCGSGIPHIYFCDYSKASCFLPSLAEQKKIAGLLSAIDERIETQSAVIKDQEALKGVLSKRLLTPEEDWMELAIRDCLTYEQPTKYIVRSTAYSSDSTLTPVLTANKGFILGYTNEQETYQKGACIIFDDFTLDCKYVPFVFKVKSSAIKILQAKEGFAIRFMFEVIKSLSLSPLAHKRHYISEVEPIKVLVPSFAKQEKIVRLFAALDERLAIEKEYAALLKEQKAYLLQQMFV